jgi:ABC-type lipoprotein release transport system permease subunit
MWLLTLARKNMWRNRNRTMITMAAIFFAVVLSTLASSLKEGIFDNLVKNVVSFYSGYIQVHKQGYWEEQILDNSFEASENIEKEILSEKNITGITPRLESFALASSEKITKGCLVVGIDPEKENRLTSLKNKITSGNYVKKEDYAVLLSQGLAERLNLKINDTIILIGQGYHGATAAGKYSIKGIVKFGSPELNDKSLFMPLALAQDFYNAYGMVTSLVLSIADTKKLLPTVLSVKSKLPMAYEVMSWEEMMPDVKQHIATDSNNMKYVQGILYMLICFGILGTLLMMMIERKFELGMLVAIGMKKIKLMILLMIESVFTVLTGCVLGILASIPLIYYLSIHPLKMGGETAKAYERFGFEAVFPTSMDAANFINQGITVLILALIISLYPVYKIIKMDPVSAMKK